VRALIEGVLRAHPELARFRHDLLGCCRPRTDRELEVALQRFLRRYPKFVPLFPKQD
jgi:hypothetical protein